MDTESATSHEPSVIALWAERRRVHAHLTDGRADADKCTCRDRACMIAQDVADFFRRRSEI